MHQAETQLRVRYAETDQMGIVYYANYFIWMEVGRVDYCRQMGFEYADMESQDGALLTVSEANCRYRAPARFNDELRVLTKVLESRSRTIRFGYEIRREADRRLLATGETLHTICGRDGKMMRLPEKYRPYFPLTNGDE